MRLLFIIDGYYPDVGWAEVLFQNLAEGMISQGDSVTILTIGSKQLPVYEQYHGVTIHRIRCHRKLFPLYGLFKAYRLGYNSDIIHTSTYSSAPLAWIVAKLLQKPITITIHEIYGNLWIKIRGKYIGWLAKQREYLICNLPYHHIIWPSDYTVSSISMLFWKKGHLSRIYNGVDNNQRYPTIPSSNSTILRTQYTHQYILLFAWRPSIEKWFIDLLEAISLVRKASYDIGLIAIVSYTTYRHYQRIQDLIQQYKLEDAVHILDSVPYHQLPNRILMSDAVVIPSYTEWFGLWAAEVSALWHPIVVSNVWALPEVVSWCAVWTKPWDTSDLSDSIIKILNNNHNITNYIPHKSFDRQDTIDEYKKVWKNIIEKKSKL